MITYKNQIKKSMQILAQDHKRVFIGYGVKIGGKAAGTLEGINPNQLIETPVAENLMLGLAIGLSLQGYKPVVFYERFDFVMNAMDALVNHLDKIKEISNGQFNPSVIIRVVVGGTKKPFFTGITHTQDYSNSLYTMLHSCKVINLDKPSNIIYEYDQALMNSDHYGISSIIIEEKDRYDDCENFQ